MESARHSTSSTASTVKNCAVFNSMNAGTVSTMNDTQAMMSIFLRPNLSDRCPMPKMNATYATRQIVVISDDSFAGIMTTVSR